MPKIRTITISAEFRVSQSYQSVSVGGQCEVELEDGDNCAKIRREYGLSLRRQCRAEAESALNALLDQRSEEAAR